MSCSYLCKVRQISKTLWTDMHECDCGCDCECVSVRKIE